MMHRTSLIAGNRELLHVAVGGSPGAPVKTQAREAISRAVAEIELAGLPAGHIVRSRLWGRDAEARRIGSDMRLEVLAGARRGASSSYIDSERLPAGVDVMIELYALRSAAAADAKRIVEYDPEIPPPRFVVLDGLLVLSGDTDRSEGIEAQLTNIRAKLDATLAAGGGSWERVISMSVHLAKRLLPGIGRAMLTAKLPPLRCATSISTVEGYSNPEKLVEIELTADLSDGQR